MTQALVGRRRLLAADEPVRFPQLAKRGCMIMYLVRGACQQGIAAVSLSRTTRDWRRRRPGARFCGTRRRRRRR